jgi:hypothetical protein
MNNNSAPAEVKPISQFAKLKAKLKGIGGNPRYGRFSRAQIEDLKLALVPYLLPLCERILPCGVLSKTERCWVIPALGIRVNLTTGDYFPWPFDLSVTHRLGDIVALYGLVYELPFRQAMAGLDRIAKKGMEAAPLALPLFGEKTNGREKKRLVHAALFGTSGERASQLPQSALALRRRVLGYLATAPEESKNAKTVHPEFFSPAAFSRLLREWVTEARAEFFRIEERNRGAKDIRFLLSNLDR